MTAIYLDHNATTPVSASHLQAVAAAVGEGWANPSSPHAWGRAAHVGITAIRNQLGVLLGCEGGEVIFTSGATESNNLGTSGVVMAALAAAAQGNNGASGHKCPHVICGPTEHPSVMEPLAFLNAENLISLTVLKPDNWGRCTVTQLQEALTPETVLVTLMAANNETGVIYPVKAFADFLHALRWQKHEGKATASEAAAALPPDVTLEHLRRLHFHVDGVQALGKIPVDEWMSKGIDSASISAHKIGGIAGVGALLLRRGRRLAPLLRGGSQERNRRAGTENLVGIVSLGLAVAALDQRGTWGVCDQLRAAVAQLRESVQGYPFVTLNTPPVGALCNTLNFSVESSNLLGEDVLIQLDINGIFAASGSACSSGANLPSQTLLSMGRSVAQAKNAVRLSLGPCHAAADTARVLGVLSQILGGLS